MRVKNVDMTGCDRLINLGTSIFNECSALRMVDMSGANKLMLLSPYMFDNCSSLHTILFPETLETIDSYSFNKCSSLESVKFPASIRAIGVNAFNECTGMKSVDFSRCVSLTMIPSQAFFNCSSLELLDLSSCISLTTIGEFAFSGCSTLSTINFPSSLIVIERSAFAGCTNLLHMSIPCTIPPILEVNSEPFAGVDNIDCTLSIPTEKFFAYYSANYWGGFVDVENKGQIDIDVTKPSDENNSDAEECGSAENEHKDSQGCRIHYKKYSSDDTEKHNVYANTLNSIVPMFVM